MQRGYLAWLLPIACTLLLTSALPLATANGLTGQLETQHDITITGTTNASAPRAIVHTPGDWALSQAARADQIVIDTTWKQGYRAERTDTELRPDEGHDRHWFNDSTLSLKPFRAAADLLVTGNGNPHVNASGQGPTTATVADDERLVNAGFPDGGQEAGDVQRVGFWFEIDGPWPALKSLDHVQIQGNLTLFVHNATMTVTEPDQSTWTNWTGYEENRAPGPSPIATPQGTATAFELRVTTITLTNTTLALDAPDTVNLYARELTPTVSGTVQGERAHGQLETLPALFTYENDPFQLDGAGSLALSARPSGAQSSDGPEPGSLPGLVLEPDGNFEVVETQGIERHTANGQTDGGVLGPLSPSWMTGLLLLLPLGAVAGLALRRSRAEQEHDPSDEGASHAQIAPLALPDDDVYRERLDHALDLHRAYQFERARKALERIAKDYPHMPEPWFRLAQLYNETGDAEAALDALDRFEAIVGRGDPDALAQRVTIHWAMDERESARHAFLELAHHEPKRASNILQHSGLLDLGHQVIDQANPELLDHWLDWALRNDRMETAQRVFVHLVDRGPELARPYLSDPTHDGLVRGVLDELPVPALATLVREAWLADRLDLARTAFLRLVNQAPLNALELVEQPVFEPLGDDPRVQPVLERYQQQARREQGTDQE